MRTEIRIAGTGGQGQVLAAELLASAAGLQGYEVAQTQFYEAAIRGGTSTGDVVLSDTRITYPWVHKPGIFVATHQLALAYRAEEARVGTTDLSLLEEDALVLVDSVFVDQVPPMRPQRIFRTPLTLTADGVGLRRTANMVLLGLLSKLTDLVSMESLETAIRDRVPARFLEINLKALQAGYALETAQLEPVHISTA
jgi:2-oxoglutarate ferredoxin oxidoreductase subunit gamma